METFLFHIDPKYRLVFKSYYVVWKPGLPRQNINEIYMFKSYYVVWKPLPAKPNHT